MKYGGIFEISRKLKYLNVEVRWKLKYLNVEVRCIQGSMRYFNFLEISNSTVLQLILPQYWSGHNKFLVWLLYYKIWIQIP
jgi:hypothetical protein